jgi:hypothetical protein
MNTPRLLKADEISCRIQQVTSTKGAVVLLYKDARVDMSILDETYGPMNWQRGHREIGGKMFCVISVWDDEKKQWIAKEDVGVESNTEATKGEASDSFKRSGTNWGIGRELYTAPFIYIQLQDSEVKQGNGGKWQAVSSFVLSVHSIEYNDAREIKSLVLKDRNDNVRYTYGTKASKKEEKPIPASKLAETQKTTPAKVEVTPAAEHPMTTKERVESLCNSLRITFQQFGDIYTKLQTDGKIPNKKTAELMPSEWQALIPLMQKAAKG